jgi:septum formation protein
VKRARVVLASASPRRLDLLQAVGYDVVTAVSGAAEEEFSESGPESLALLNARRKWQLVAQKNPSDHVIAADTVVWLDGRFYGKPSDMADAERMIQELSGQTHLVVTGVVLGRGEASPVEFAETTHVTFHALTLSEIQDYLASINPLDKAGAYAAQNDEGRIIRKIDGLLSNVIGLPVERVLESLPLSEA